MHAAHAWLLASILLAGCSAAKARETSPRVEPAIGLELEALIPAWASDHGYWLDWLPDNQTLIASYSDEWRLLDVDHGASDDEVRTPPPERMPGLVVPGVSQAAPLVLAAEAGLLTLDARGQIRNRVGPFHRLRASDLKLSPDGQWAMLHDWHFVMGVLRDGQLIRPDGPVIVDLNQSSRWFSAEDLFARHISDVVWLDQGQRIACAWYAGNHGESGGISVIDTKGKLLREINDRELGGRPRSFQLRPDGESIALSISPYMPFAKSAPRVVLLDPESLEIVQERGVTFAPAVQFLDSQTLLVAPPWVDAQLELWDARSLETRATLPIEVAGSMAVSPNGERLAIWTEEGVRIYRILRKEASHDDAAARR